MIVLDTSIIGTFAVIGEMNLFLALFGEDEVGVAPAVYAEVLQGLREGRVFLQLAADMITEGSLRLLALTPDEISSTFCAHCGNSARAPRKKSAG